jgi:hypothetical protein
LSQLLKSQIERKIFVNISQIIGLFIFAMFLAFTDKQESILSIATTSNFLLIFLSLLYYIEFQSRGELIRGDDAFFNIVTGIFLSSGMLTPILLTSKFLKAILTRESFQIISCIAPISSIIFYVFTIKSIKCSKVDI